MKYLLSYLCLLSSLKSTVAQEKLVTTDSVFKLEEAVVIDNYLKTSLSNSNREVQIIDKKMIAQLPVKTLDELLRYAIGIDVRQRGAGGVQADIAIDGGTFDQSMLLLNGMILTDPQTGHNMMMLPFSLTDIERIEIIRGSAASLYGVNALLGAINIVTKKEIQNEYTIHANVGSSLQGDSITTMYNDYLLNASANIVVGKWQQLFSGQLSAGNGYRYNTAYKNKKLFYQGNVDINNKTNVFYQVGYVNTDFGANGFYAAPGDVNAHENVSTYMAMAQINQAISKKWNTSLKYGYQYKLDDYKYIVEPLVGNNIHRNNMHQLEWNNKLLSSIGHFNAGVAMRYDAIESTNLGDRNRNNLGLFGGYQKQLGKLQFKLHAYLNHNSQYGWQLYPGVDLGGKINKNMKWFVNAGMGQRLPTFTDLYYNQANLIIGNPNLLPERSVSFSGGWTYKREAQQLQALVFYRTVDQFIDWVKNASTEAWQPQNFQTLNTFGFSLSYANTVKLQRNILSKIDYKLAYNYLQPTIHNNASYFISRYAINNLKHQLIVYGSFYFGDKLTLSPGLRYYERVSYKDYYMVNLRLSYQMKSWMLYADADNIFNEKVIEAGANPLPGFWLRLGGQLKF